LPLVGFFCGVEGGWGGGVGSFFVFAKKTLVGLVFGGGGGGGGGGRRARRSLRAPVCSR